MKLRNRTIQTQEQNTNNKSTKIILQPNNNFLQLTREVQKNIINNFKEIQLQTIEERREINNKIMNTLETITKQTNNFEETRKKRENETNKNTIILILFSIGLAGTISYISLELGEILVTNALLLPIKMIESMGKYTIGYLFTYKTNYLTESITSFSLPKDLKDLEYIIKFYVTIILSFIVYTLTSIMRLMTNISSGELPITITPLSFKIEETKTSNIVSNRKNIKSICDTIKEIYSNKKNNIDIEKSICYDKE